MVEVIISAALNGDLEACKLVIQRLCPPLKSQAAEIAIDLPIGGDLVALTETILKATANGDFPPDVASQMVTAVGQLAKIVELTELKNRLQALEYAFKGTECHANKI